MPNISRAIIAKSDQLNYDDIGTREIVIRVNNVTVNNTDQPVSIFYDGCNNRPYKPCKSMLRLICDAWGEETDNWIGKSMRLYGDPTVKWAGAEVGGIRINAFSDIDKNGISCYVTITRGKKRKVKIDYLEPQLSVDEQWVQAVLKDPNVINQIDNAEYRSKIERLVKER